MLLGIGHVTLFAVPALLAFWTFRGPLRRSPWPSVIAIVYFGRICISDALANVRAPREWDYGCFWLYGHLAALHKNLYDPAVLAAFPLPFRPSPEFVSAVIDVGFPYPPPTIALFYPLGFIDSIPTGLAIWYAVGFVALAGAAWVLARTLMPAEGRGAALLVFALVLALPATKYNIGNAQTNYLLLLVIALTLAGRATVRGAVWQTLAIWIKPYTAALFLIDVVRGRWGRLGVAIATGIASLLGAAALLGPQTMVSILQSNPAAREPAFTFVEMFNQSLLAVVLRAHHILPEHISALHEPLYIAIAITLLAITAVLCARVPRDSDLAFSSALLLGMLIYPATLASYGVALILPLLVVWRHRDTLPGRTAAVIALAAIVALLQSRVQYGFGANLTLWLCCAGMLATQAFKASAPKPIRPTALPDISLPELEPLQPASP